MKKTIITLSIVFSMVLAALAQCGGCQAKSAFDASCEQYEVKELKEVQLLYFHATRRCATCEAVEKVSNETVKSEFSSAVSFVSINREEKKNKELVKKYKVSGQTLLLVKGDKVVNLTNDAFMYARTKPEKFEAKLKAAINELI